MRIVVGGARLLAAVCPDDLAEVALLIEQPYAHDRDAQVACGLELIAGDVAEPSGVDGQRLGKSEFHAEVGHASQSRRGMRLLKPARRAERAIQPLARGAQAPAERGRG